MAAHEWQTPNRFIFFITTTFFNFIEYRHVWCMIMKNQFMGISEYDRTHNNALEPAVEMRSAGVYSPISGTTWP